MKVSEKIKRAEKDGRPFWSFEYFPPKTENGLVNLYDRIVSFGISLAIQNCLFQSPTTSLLTPSCCYRIEWVEI